MLIIIRNAIIAEAKAPLIAIATLLIGSRDGWLHVGHVVLYFTQAVKRSNNEFITGR
jgi:hypothetical protein